MSVLIVKVSFVNRDGKNSLEFWIVSTTSSGGT